MNKIFSFTNPGSFLDHTQADLEAEEAINSLTLGVCMRMRNQPGWETGRACLKVIEDDGGLALAAMMTPPHNLSVTGHPLDPDCAMGLLVGELASEGWTVPGILAPDSIARLFAEQWAKKTGLPFHLFETLHLFDLRQVLLPPPPPEQGRLRQASGADLPLVGRWRYNFNMEIFQTGDEAEMMGDAQKRVQAGDVFVWETGGQPVSVAMKNRPTRRSICVSQVYTPPEQRGKGYATACVSELSRQLLQSGWEFCTLFVNVANLPAYHAYQRIGYRLVEEFEEYHFQMAE